MVFVSRLETLNVVLLPHLHATISKEFVQLSGKIKCDQDMKTFLLLF